MAACAAKASFHGNAPAGGDLPGGGGATATAGTASGSANANANANANASATAATSGAGGVDLSASAGPATSGAGGSCVETSAEAKQGTLPADIVIAVDNSGSMTKNAQMVQDNMNQLASVIAQSGVDAHVILITNASNDDNGICVPAPLGSGSCPNDENLPGYRHVDQDIGSHDALEYIVGTHWAWKDSLRPNATRHVAVVTDDDSDISAAQFTSALLQADPSFNGFRFDAIASPYKLLPGVCEACTIQNKPCDQCDPCCAKSGFLCVPLPQNEGKVYKQLVAQTSGVLGNLCTQQFLPVFQDMAKSVVQLSKVPCVYDIPPPPNAQNIDFDKVNVALQTDPKAKPAVLACAKNGAAGCDANGGWYYDDPNKPTKVMLCPASCDQAQASPSAKVTVKFGCATILK